MAPLTLKKQEKATSKESWVTNVSQPYSSQEVRAGFLFTAAVVMLLALLLLSGKSQLGSMQQVEVKFNYIGGLEENAPVHFAGHKAGKVTDIRFTPKEESLITVRLALPKDVPVHADSQVYVDALGFMGEKYVEITAGTPGSPVLEKGTALQGTDPMPVMELVKKGTELMAEFEKTNASMNHLIDDMGKLFKDNEGNLGDIFTNLNASSANLKEMTHDLKYHPWKIMRKGKEKSANEIAEIERKKQQEKQ